jgi:hypothetical protein
MMNRTKARRHRARSLPAVVLACGVLFLASCRSSWKSVERHPSFAVDDARPMRVAALPFRNHAGGTSLLTYPFLPFIYLANLLTLSIPKAPPDSDKGAMTLRSLLVAKTAGSPICIIPTRASDTALGHLGLLDKAADMDPVELGRILSVDAILYGDLDDWSGHYYVIESRSVVEGGVRLVSCLDRRELLKIRAGVSDAAGVSGGPTGYISAAATPLAALGSGPFRDLAVKWANVVGDELGRVEGVANREPGAMAPQTSPPFIAASAASLRLRGLQQEPAAGDWIEVVALGAPGCQASFDLGTLHCRVPMTEVARLARAGAEGETAATYRGSLKIGPEDAVESAPIIVTLRNSLGTATQVSSGPAVTLRASAPVQGSSR